MTGQSSTSGGSATEKGKDWQLELLMEKLRSKSSTFKPLVETAKNMRMAMLVSNRYYFIISILKYIRVSNTYNFVINRINDLQLIV